MKIVDKRTGTSVDRRQDTISNGTVFSGRTDYGSILTVLLKTAGGVVGIHLIAIDCHRLCSICTPTVQAEIHRAMVAKRKGVAK